MKNIVIMDAYSTVHVGNGALLENSISICKQAFPDSTITILSLDKKTNQKKYNDVRNILFSDFAVGQPKYKQIFWGVQQSLFMLFQTINIYSLKINISKIFFNKDQKNAVDAISKADICISITGEALNDNFYKALYFWLFSYWMVKKHNKKMVIFPQSIGPLDKEFNKKIVYKALKNADLIVGRDQKSYNKLIELGFKDNIMYSPDVAIIQEINEDYKIEQYFDIQNEKKVIGITVSKIPDEITTNVDYINEIIKSIQNTIDSKEYKILLMPSNYSLKGKSQDYILCEKVKNELEKDFDCAILSLDPLFPMEYKSLLCQLELFISTRMHVAILSTSGEIPTITINTQHKIRGYMENIKMNDYCLDFDELEKLPVTLNKMIIENTKIRSELKENLKIMHNDLNKFVERFKAI